MGSPICGSDKSQTLSSRSQKREHKDRQTKGKGPYQKMPMQYMPRTLVIENLQSLTKQVIGDFQEIMMHFNQCRQPQQLKQREYTEYSYKIINQCLKDEFSFQEIQKLIDLINRCTKLCFCQLKQNRNFNLTLHQFLALLDKVIENQDIDLQSTEIEDVFKPLPQDIDLLSRLTKLNSLITNQRIEIQKKGQKQEELLVKVKELLDENASLQRQKQALKNSKDTLEAEKADSQSPQFIQLVKKALVQGKSQIHAVVTEYMLSKQRSQVGSSSQASRQLGEAYLKINDLEKQVELLNKQHLITIKQLNHVNQKLTEVNISKTLQSEHSKSETDQKIENLEQKSLQLQTENDKLRKELEQLELNQKDQESSLSVKLKELGQENTSLKQVIRNLEEQVIRSSTDQNTNKQRDSKFQDEELSLKLERTKTENNKLVKDLETFSGKIAEKENQLSKTLRELSYKDRQIQQLKEVNMKTGEELHQLREQMVENGRMRTWSFVEHKTLFIGDILKSRKDEKKYLISTIETYMSNKIEDTKCLYDYNRDCSSKITFHEKTKDKTNLAMVVETEKALFVGYYSGLMKQKGPMNERSLIISLNNRKFYQLKAGQKMRGLTYDPYYMIFGNSEIRIKVGDRKVFSNFGIMNAFFDNGKDKVHQLLGEGNQNEVVTLNYQIHEIKWAEEQYVA